MPSSTGSELTTSLQDQVDLLWVLCVNCSLTERQGTWERGLLTLRSIAGDGFECAEMDDAVQDAGFRLGMFHFNAQSARFYGAAMG